MTVVLAPELERLIAEKIESGRYSTPDEVVAEGLRLIHEQETVNQTQMNRLRRDVNLGFDQIERGEGQTYSSTAELAEKIKSVGHARLSTHQKVGA